MEIDETRPIWAQLVDEFRRRIAAHEWPAGSKLPSVRELALELGVNPNTVQKALAEVDRQGLTATERTAGRFVSTDSSAVQGTRHAIAVDATDAFIASAVGLGLTLTEATALLTQRWPAPLPPALTDSDTSSLTPTERMNP